MFQPSTLLKYAMDMLITTETNYGDSLAPVHIDNLESQNGAMSQLKAMTAEEARSQFGHLGEYMGRFEERMGQYEEHMHYVRHGLRSIDDRFASFQVSLDQLRHTIGYLIPPHPVTFHHHVTGMSAQQRIVRP